MNKSKIAPATEIVVSLMSHYTDVQGDKQLQSDPRAYIYKTTHINIPEQVDLAVVHNSGETVNLILPYYEGLSSSIEEVQEKDMSDVVGGSSSYSGLSLLTNEIVNALIHSAHEQSKSDWSTSGFGQRTVQQWL